MQAADKFRSDLEKAVRLAAAGARAGAAAGAKGSALPPALADFIERQFPAVRGEMGAALAADLAEKWRGNPEAAAAWLGTIGSILAMDYDGSPLSEADWAGLREAANAGAGELDLELLEYVMSLVLDHGAL